MNNVNITGGTLVDTFPAGAIVVDAQGGVVDYTNHTITWTVDPQDARSGQYYCTTTCVRYIKFPTLRFPADLFPAGTYTNYAQATFNYSDGSSGVLNDSQSITTMDAAPHLKVEKYGPGTLGDFGRFRWDFRVTNDGNTNLSNVVAIDALPTTGFSDATVAVDYGNGGQVINLSYQAADGTWVDLTPCNPGGGGSCPAQAVPARRNPHQGHHGFARDRQDDPNWHPCHRTRHPRRHDAKLCDRRRHGSGRCSSVHDSQVH
ncbi:MAG: hypothetical protein V9E81_14620 [Marmoricola sp.]